MILAAFSGVLEYLLRAAGWIYNNDPFKTGANLTAKSIKREKSVSTQRYNTTQNVQLAADSLHEVTLKAEAFVTQSSHFSLH